jgi:hypothetical protein
MILAGDFRRCTFIADYFPGEPGRRTVQSITARIALTGNPDNRITQTDFFAKVARGPAGSANCARSCVARKE